MPITINQAPSQYEPAFQNTIPFAVTSDLATASNFRYIFETYTGDSWDSVNNFQSFNSAYPRFNDNCIYSPHLILQSVVDYTLDPFITDFTPCTQSFQFYRIDFGEQYNPNLFFINTFPSIAPTPDELFLIFPGTVSTFQIGDQIRIDKTDKSINPQYDGYTTVTGVFPITFGTQSFTFVETDTIYGIAPTIGTFSFPETGFVNDLIRLAATTSGTYSTFNGVRQYDEIDESFEDIYGIDIDYVDFIQNGEFDSNDFWNIINQLGGTASIGGGVLNYIDTAGGNGTALVYQEDVLTIGEEYRVTINVSNNNFVLINVGDETNTYLILNDDNGTFTTTFTAVGNDFYIELNSAGGVTQGVDVNYIKVEALFATQNRFLSVYPQNTPYPIYLSDYQTLSFFTDPNYPDFSYYGLPRIAFSGELYDPQGNIVNSFTRYMEDYQNLSFNTPRFDIPTGPAIDTQGNFFTSSINCDGWSYKIWLDGVNLTQHLLNPTFSSSTASWLITTDGNATASFGGGLFEMQQEVEFATGSILLEQSNVFTPGLTYALVMGIVNNDDVEVYIGDSDNMVQTANSNETGNEIIFPFVPTSPTFSAEFIATDFGSYGIEVDYIYAVTVGTTSRISEIKEYDIKCQCREYDLVQLAFVNKLGGVDYWTFNLVSKFTSNIMRDRIKKTLPYNYNQGNRQHKIINQKIEEQWQVNTDYLTDEQGLFIRELIESPEVYWIKNDKLYPIIITQDTYEFKSTLNDMLVQYTINFSMAFDRLSNA